MFEEVRENSFIPIRHTMDNPDPEWCLSFFYFSFSFTFYLKEFFFFLISIFYRMRIIDITLTILHEEEVEGTIDRECEDET